MTCRRADAFLEERAASVGHQVDARKERVSPDEAVKLARSVRHLYVAKGKKVVHFDMQTDPPAAAELKKLLIGPSGNLRAPTARAGDRLFVGFHPEEFAAGLWGD
ncbi:MAG TPA: ArsC family (seleno)protein [Planctomycetaceae bacterium]